MHELYQVLGVRSDAADEVIKATFRRLAKQLHPDLHPGAPDTERRLQEVIRASETLSDRPMFGFRLGLTHASHQRCRWSGFRCWTCFTT